MEVFFLLLLKSLRSGHVLVHRNVELVGNVTTMGTDPGERREWPCDSVDTDRKIE